MRGLEAYQSGMLISAEGHILTVWSYVLDVDPVVVLDDGRVMYHRWEYIDKGVYGPGAKLPSVRKLSTARLIGP